MHTGDMKPIRTLLSGAADAESRAAILRALLEAGPDALAALAADAASLRAIDLWLLQTMPETRAFHLLGLALKARSAPKPSPLFNSDGHRRIVSLGWTRLGRSSLPLLPSGSSVFAALES